MSKRGPEFAASTVAKRPATECSFYAIGLVSNQEELDAKVLLVQNKNLSMKLEWLRSEVKDLKSKNVNLEKAKEMHDSTISTVGRFWERLENDVLNLLSQFDDNPPEKDDAYSEGVAMFLERLGADDTGEGLEKGLAEKQQFTNSIISKLLELIEQSRQIWRANGELFGSADCDLEEIVKEENGQMRQEIERLQNKFLEITEKERTASHKVSNFEDTLRMKDNKIRDLHDQVSRLSYENEKAREQVERHKRRLSDLIKQQQQLAHTITCNSAAPAGETKEEEEDAGNSSELQLLADERLKELQELQARFEHVVKELELMKLEQRIGKSASDTSLQNNFKSLQAQFTLLYNENEQVKQQLEETKHLLAQRCQQHLLQLEQIEVEEDAAQKKMKQEVVAKEEALANIKKDYQVLHFKFQRYLAANEQTGPSNKEMRNMIQSLQAHNTLLKNEVTRSKKRTSELAVQIAKCRDKQELEGTEAMELVKELAVTEDKQKEEQNKKRIDELTSTIKDLQKQLKTSHENQKELKLLLDVFKGSVKESRSKVELLASEKRLQEEVSELTQNLRKKEKDLETAQKRAAGLSDDEISAQLAAEKKLNEQIKEELQEKSATSVALGEDVELLGNAFEDLQEQNMRLQQQLKEKDDANFKLMSERIKADELLKLLREEKELLGEYTTQLKNQKDSQMALVRKVEERERQIQGSLSTLEKEIQLKQQAIDLHKKESSKHCLNYNELKASYDTLNSEATEIRKQIAEKTAVLESELFKGKRKEEDLLAYKRKLDRHKKDNPLSTTIDEVLEEEVRMYKQKLTCPVCNVRKKDAVLTKCYHIFCFECMKLRYDTRQRKCPKCNAAFGASDFHRIYM
ncbi:E3 ubiquitin-protein ligase BRE1A-like isoform X2 [Bolinopsis microptera]|uniref:E3 ubiquitin-protein ligase BRE1A-like isoform X2 n=1 Tax=Bolinopsis microptera TaxID=2820187 RepID=UPI0030796ABE